MPKNPYPGIKLYTDNHNYYETKISFDKIYNIPKLKNIEKPIEQGSLDSDRVDKMIDEYKNHPTFLRFKNRVIIGNLNDTWYIIDGQHRVEMSKKIYEDNNEINDYLIYCWFTCNNENDMRLLFNSVNKDSTKNNYYIQQKEFDQIKINEFTKLLKNYYKSSFSNKKTISGKIKTIEELRDDLIKINFFTNNKSLSIIKLYEYLLQKNNEFYKINRYEINIKENLDNFYKDEHKHIENNIIFSLKNANFIKWLENPNENNPFHKNKKEKKRISRQLKLQCWIKEFNNNECGICPILDCSIILDKNISNWQAGHIISEYNNGETTINNLRPICKNCNLAMGSKNWNDYDDDMDMEID